MNRYPSPEPQSCSTIIFEFLLGILVTSLLIWWYSCLWSSRLQFTYWSQSLPLAALVSPLTYLYLCRRSGGAGTVIRTLWGLLSAASLIAQAAVWLGMLKAPIF